MKKVKCVSLVMDMTIYPRIAVNDQRVGDIARFLRAGNETPAILVDKKSRRITDGFTRNKAHLRVYGPEAEIDTMEKSYRNLSEMILDSIRLNATHGANLTSSDRARSAMLASEAGATMDQVAEALHVTTDYVGKLVTDRTAYDAEVTTRKNSADAPIVVLKRPTMHLRGKKLSKRQADANRKLLGSRQSFLINQVITLIEGDVLQKNDTEVMDRLEHLGKLIDKLVGQPA